MTEKRTRPGTGKLQVYWLAYNVALETDVAELLETLEVRAYTRWDEVKGRGRSGPHLNDAVWPAVNAVYMFAAPAALEARLLAEVKRLRARYPGEGIKCIVQPCLGMY
jgi:hypothetical protein